MKKVIFLAVIAFLATTSTAFSKENFSLPTTKIVIPSYKMITSMVVKQKPGKNCLVISLFAEAVIINGKVHLSFLLSWTGGGGNKHIEVMDDDGTVRIFDAHEKEDWRSWERDVDFGTYSETITPSCGEIVYWNGTIFPF